MIARWVLLALFVVLFAPRLVHAQSERQIYDAVVGAAIDSTDHDKMYEDIEIFRRILDRKLQPLYPTHTYNTFGMMGMQGGMMGMQGGMMGMQGGMPGMQGGMTGTQGGFSMSGGMIPTVIPIRSLEGVYLKGRGVVYTATLSSLGTPTEATKTEPAKSVSEWESIRRQVRNEKEEPKKTEPSKPPSLSDVLLKQLAENGHHFSQLGENESLTIVITVHLSKRPELYRKSTGGGGSGGSSKTGRTARKTGDGSDFRGKANDLELLGDLHQKQAKYEEAIAAFLKAHELQPADPQLGTRLYQKLAQCYLAQEKLEQARSALDKAAEFWKNAQEAAGSKDTQTAAVRSSPGALPIKLIVSAPKKLLDQVKEGKIPFEEFRRRAHVETVRVSDRSR